MLGELWRQAVSCPAPSCCLPGGLTPTPQPGRSPHLHVSGTPGAAVAEHPVHWGRKLLAHGSAQALASFWQEALSATQRGLTLKANRARDSCPGPLVPPSLLAP